MTEEEYRLLVENNQMLKFICNYIYSQYYNSSSNDIKDFMMNVIANVVANGGKSVNILLKVIK